MSSLVGLVEFFKELTGYLRAKVKSIGLVM